MDHNYIVEEEVSEDTQKTRENLLVPNNFSHGYQYIMNFKVKYRINNWLY